MNKTKKWFKKGKFYRGINGDGTTRGGFKNNLEIGAKNEAKDWNADPNIGCGQGIHVVEGHPLLVFETVSRNDPVFFEVETYPNPPILSSNGDKYRCQYVINKRIITNASPEFHPKILAQIATACRDYDVRKVAVEKLNPEKHSELLAQIATEDGNYDVRKAAVEKLDPENRYTENKDL